MADRAVFLDRDGTLIEEVGYPTRPEHIRILAGVARALQRMADAGYKLVVVTNQSGVARGLLTEEDLERFHHALDEQLDVLGVRLDAYYICPHLPDAVAAKRQDLAVECDCRKPKPGLILRAAEDLHVDLASSWAVGDTWRDIAAGQAAGVRTIKLPTDPSHDSARPPDVTPTAEAADLAAAADIILGTREPQALAAAAPATPPAPTADEVAPEAPAAAVTAEPAAPAPSEAEPGAPVPEPPAAPLADVKPAGLAPADDGPAAAPAAPQPIAPYVPEEEPGMDRGDSAAATLRGTCARCGQDVPESDAASGRAAERDGFLLCAECLDRLPRAAPDRLPEGAEGLLREILSELRRLGRARRGGSLTLLRLLAYIVQAAALFCGLVLGLGADKPAFLQVAILMQLLVLALLLLERNS